MGTGQLRLPFAETPEPLRALWQARFYDFNGYGQGKKMEKLNYMHANPAFRGLVKHPKDWPRSSWGFYYGGGPGLVRIAVEERERKVNPRTQAPKTEGRPPRYFAL